jgi:uncharacterized protein (DUF111 family)
LKQRPNALRVVLGTVPDAGDFEAGESHVVLEANVDDMTGELAAHVMRLLIAAGALDVWAIPVTMKKGRPGQVLSVLAEASQVGRLAELMLSESTSLGVRHRSVGRTELPRTLITVTTPFGQIPVKVAGAGGLGHAKPEFDACARAAAEHQVPVRVVVDAALRAFAQSE